MPEGNGINFRRKQAREVLKHLEEILRNMKIPETDTKL